MELKRPLSPSGRLKTAFPNNRQKGVYTVNDIKDRIVYAIAAVTTALIFIGGALLILLVGFRALGGF